MKKLIYLFIGLFIFMTLSAYSHENQIITKSINDLRKYQYKVLDNGLKLLVISDPQAQRAAASVDVSVGSSAEPDGFPGLAHFLEHMLFLGTDKYPNPDDYINYISNHGGSHNAFTAFDHTNYFFDIDPDYLHDSLKRFSRFFVSPLMSKKYVEREKNAVDSEYKSKLKEDSWRSMDAFKQLINPKHPYSRFSIGSNETLSGDKVVDALHKFYKKYYSSDRMAVTIIGKESTKELLNWGRELFSEVPKAAKNDLTIKEEIFSGKKLPIILKSRSIKDKRNLSMQFILPFSIETIYNKSLLYLASVIGYEGKGSLLEALKKQGYVNNLNAYWIERISGKDKSSFSINSQLTDKGYKNINNVIAIIFSYIDLLKNDNNSKSRYQEIKTIAQKAFQYQEKKSAINEVSELSTELNILPAKDILAIGSIFTGFNAEQVNSYIKLLKPDNAVIQITAPDIESKTKTKYFSVPYLIEEPNKDKLTKIADIDKEAVNAMFLPKANEFIADDYSLKKITNDYKEKSLVLDNGIELFFKNDISFNVPRSNIEISLLPSSELDTLGSTKMSLISDIINEQLNSVMFDAILAGLDSNISGGRALNISISGYQQKIPKLLQNILKYISDFSVSDDIFNRVKIRYKKYLENMSKDNPYSQTFSYLSNYLVPSLSTPDKKLAALDNIDKDSLKVFLKNTLKSLSVRMMVYGNNTFVDAKDLANNVSNSFPKTNFKNNWYIRKLNIIEKDISKKFNDNHTDSAITYYIQGDNGYSARAQVGILAKMIEPHFFTELRTEKQLGYIVFAYPKPIFNQSGIAFTIQSPVATSDELEKHITDFNKNYSDKLKSLTKEEFDKIKSILKSELLQKPENLNTASSRYWFDILTTGKTTSSIDKVAKAIDNANLAKFKEDMIKLLTKSKRVIIKANPNK